MIGGKVHTATELSKFLRNTAVTERPEPMNDFPVMAIETTANCEIASNRKAPI